MKQILITKVAIYCHLSKIAELLGVSRVTAKAIEKETKPTKHGLNKKWYDLKEWCIIIYGSEAGQQKYDLLFEELWEAREENENQDKKEKARTLSPCSHNF